MKTEYKYMTMRLINDSGKTTVWDIINRRSGIVLGGIGWYSPWREYVFFTTPNIAFNTTCLSDIQDFIKQLMDERKEKLCLKQSE
ncbi:MAG: hypothetical protein ABSH16_00015 [Sedimentisphaerales bacterium]